MILVTRKKQYKIHHSACLCTIVLVSDSKRRIFEILLKFKMRVEDRPVYFFYASQLCCERKENALRRLYKIETDKNLKKPLLHLANIAPYDLANAYKDEIMASRAVSRRPHFCRYSKSDWIHDEAKLFDKHKKILENLMLHTVDLSTLDPQPDLISEYELAYREKDDVLDSLLTLLPDYDEGGGET